MTQCAAIHTCSLVSRSAVNPSVTSKHQFACGRLLAIYHTQTSRWQLTCRDLLQAFPEKALNKLEDYGFIQSRPKGEYHANNQQMSKLLHKAVGLGGKGAAPQACSPKELE